MKEEIVYTFEFIDILTAAFVHLKTIAPKQTTVSVSSLSNFANAVAKLLISWHQKVSIHITKQQILDTLNEYSIYFEPDNGNIKLKENADINKLSEKVFSNISGIALIALQNEKAALTLIKEDKKS